MNRDISKLNFPSDISKEPEEAIIKYNSSFGRLPFIAIIKKEGDMIETDYQLKYIKQDFIIVEHEGKDLRIEKDKTLTIKST